MKRLLNMGLIILLLILMGVVLSGCSPEEDASTPEEIPVEPAEQAEEAPSEATEGASDDAVELCSIENNEWALMKQLAFIYEGSTITLGDIADEDKMKGLFGEAVEIREHTYSKDDGRNMDQLIGMTEREYSYDGLVVKTIENKDTMEPVIFSVEITNSRYQTLRKVKVGDGYEILREAYPEGTLLGGEITEQEDDYRYEPFDYVNVMNFHIKNRLVESITIRRLLD